MVFEVGDKIHVRNMEDAETIKRALAEHGLKCSHVFSKDGAYIQVEPEDYNENVPKSHEVAVYGLMFAYGFWSIRKVLSVLKAQTGYIGYVRCEKSCIAMYEKSWQSKTALNVAKDFDLKVFDIGTMFIAKKVMPEKHTKAHFKGLK